MKAYASYVAEMRRLLHDRRSDKCFNLLAERVVNGEASAKLIELVSTFALKRTGAFFSGARFSESAAAHIEVVPSRAVLLCDPMCGAGDLLLAAAKRLPVQESLSSTLSLWGEQLVGFDVHPEFVEAAHLRLAILGLSLGARYDISEQVELADFFPRIRNANALANLGELKSITHLLLNPPFGTIKAPANCIWGNGKVTKAALILESCLKALGPNTEVSAILPDVLRAGTRYHRWREEIEKRAQVLSVSLMGNFETADVDVFLLRLRTRSDNELPINGGCRWWENNDQGRCVGNTFHVHVGAVVPHRLREAKRRPVPYLHAKGLPFWGVFTPGAERVRFTGSLVKPPFVAIRRTSSPSDRFRALATVIVGKTPVAVENHLLVCIPKSGGLEACRNLVELLKRKSTNDFLNARIRCRHLTVGVVKEIPC